MKDMRGGRVRRHTSVIYVYISSCQVFSQTLNVYIGNRQAMAIAWPKTPIQRFTFGKNHKLVKLVRGSLPD